MVDRYEYEQSDEYPQTLRIVKDPDGDYVLYTDYAALEAELEVEKANRIADVGVLKVKLAKAQARLTEQADEFAKLIQSLKLDVAARDGEIELLKHWHQTADLRAAEIVRLQSQIKRAQEIYPFLRDEGGGE